MKAIKRELPDTSPHWPPTGIFISTPCFCLEPALPQCLHPSPIWITLWNPPSASLVFHSLLDHYHQQVNIQFLSFHSLLNPLWWLIWLSSSDAAWLEARLLKLVVSSQLPSSWTISCIWHNHSLRLSWYAFLWWLSLQWIGFPSIC